MQQVLIAREPDENSPGSRDALILRHLETAIGAQASVAVRDVGTLDRGRPRPPGLQRIRTPSALVALGRAAHVGLADFEKSTIFVGDLGLETRPVDISRLMWSSLNTKRAIALGDAAWTSMQLLPIAAMATHPTPPLRMEPVRSELGAKTVRVVAHGDQPSALAAGALLGHAGFTVLSGARQWSDGAAIHVHVGSDAEDDGEPRIVDSWASGRLAIRLAGRGERASPAAGLPRIDHEINGLVCTSVADIVAACREVEGDPTFRSKLIKAGHKTVAPLLKGWAEVATQLLA